VCALHKAEYIFYDIVETAITADNSEKFRYSIRDSHQRSFNVAKRAVKVPTARRFETSNRIESDRSFVSRSRLISPSSSSAYPREQAKVGKATEARSPAGTFPGKCIRKRGSRWSISRRSTRGHLENPLPTGSDVTPVTRAMLRNDLTRSSSPRQGRGPVSPAAGIP